MGKYISPRWGLKIVSLDEFYQHLAPLGLTLNAKSPSELILRDFSFMNSGLEILFIFTSRWPSEHLEELRCYWFETSTIAVNSIFFVFTLRPEGFLISVARQEPSYCGRVFNTNISPHWGFLSLLVLLLNINLSQPLCGVFHPQHERQQIADLQNHVNYWYSKCWR